MSIMKSIFGSLVNNLTPVSLALAFKMLKIQYGILQSDNLVKIPWAIHYRDAIDMNYAYDMLFPLTLLIHKCSWMQRKSSLISQSHMLQIVCAKIAVGSGLTLATQIRNPRIYPSLARAIPTSPWCEWSVAALILFSPSIYPVPE